MQDPPAAYAASRALVNLTAAPGNFHEVLQCLVEGLKVNRGVARMRTAQVRASPCTTFDVAVHIVLASARGSIRPLK